MIKILIADDHPVIRRGLKEILLETFAKIAVDEAENSRQVLDKGLKNDYNLILLDISIPEINGLELLKELKAEKPALPVLILSIHQEELYAVRALRAGAAGYLCKQSAPAELITAIKKVLQGGRYVSASLAEKLAFKLGPNIEKPLHEALSDRELQVMCLIASGKTSSEIAEQLCLSVKTVSTYRTRILNKMQMKSNSELTVYMITSQI